MSVSQTTPAPTIGPTQELPVVLSIGFPYAPIGPCAIGGSEVILSGIEQAMPALGFRSVVVAHEGSQPAGRLYPTRVPPGEIGDGIRADVERAQQANIDRALAENPIALVHMHGLDFHRYRIPDHLPVLVTLHLPPAWYPEAIWSLPSNFHFLCVSETEHQACPESVRSRITVVKNGVPLPDISTLRPEGRYAVMLSRICAEKNLHAGLDAAKMAGLPAILAGEVFPYQAHQRYFAEQIQPRLSAAGQDHETRSHQNTDHAGARFLGPVTGSAKARLLARAACLLLPSLAPETSSLAAMEALAAGVPVIAVASGAVPEIVEDGHTGFLIGPSEDIPRAMAEAIKRLHQIDRRACRTAAEQRFGRDRMLNAYCRLYRAYALRISEPKCAFSDSVPQATPANPVVPTQVSLQQLTDPSALYALRDDWVRLWEKDKRATPFQHPAWLLPWWRQFGADGELHTVLLRGDDGHLLGMLPSYIYPQPQTGQRQLLLIGAATTDYLDALFEPVASSAELARSALHSILDQRCWDILSFMQLQHDSPLLRAQDTASLPVQLSCAQAEPCSVIGTTTSLPPKVRANARRYRRRAEASGSLASTIATSTEEALASFDDLLKLHHERWQLRGESGLLADERVVAHHREAIPQLLEAGLLRMFRLTLNDEVLGVLYALADPPQRSRGALYLYLIGINAHYADLSPGTLLLHSVWEHARNAGFTALDLLRGGETYKQLWGAEPRPTFCLRAKATLD